MFGSPGSRHLWQSWCPCRGLSVPATVRWARGRGSLRPLLPLHLACLWISFGSLNYSPVDCVFVCSVRLWANPGQVLFSPTARARPTHSRTSINVSGKTVCIATDHVINLILISQERDPLVSLYTEINQECRRRLLWETHILAL